MFEVGDNIIFGDVQYKIKSTFEYEGETRYIIRTLDGKSEIVSVSHKNLLYNHNYYRRKKLDKILSRIQNS